jgi:RNA polymerase sigma factor (sigma-70 family)
VAIAGFETKRQTMILEDKMLVWKLNNRNPDALRCIYEKYKNELLALALGLCNDYSLAEDALHDVFVSLAQFAPRLKLRSSLKGYLASSVANRLRNIQRTVRRTTEFTEADCLLSTDDNPQGQAVSAEQFRRLDDALTQLPFDQREVVLLHLQSGLKFRQIAEQKGVSINTIQSRYRYAINKLQSILNHEAKI